MVTVNHSQIQRYGVAILAVVLALLLMLLLNPWVPMTKSPFVMFFGAVMVSAWYGGLNPGVVATILSALLSAYFFIYPTFSPTVELADSVRLSLFVLEGVLISVLCGALRTTNQRLDVSLRKLQVSEQRYRRLMDTANEGIWTTDAKGRTDYVNQRLAQMLGYREEEMLERSVFDFMDEASRIEAQPRIERCQQGNKEQYDLRFRCKDGSALWTIVCSNPILGGAGEFLGILAMLTNVSDAVAAATQRKQTQEALRQREEELTLITNAVPVLISYIDSKQCYRFSNKAYEEWFGYSSTQVCGKHVQDVLGEAAYEMIRPYIEMALSGQQVTFERQIPYKDGGLRYIKAIYVPHISAQGDVEGFVGLVSDITASKQTEAALRESEGRFRRLAEANIIGVIFWDIYGNITDANDAFLGMIGYTREDLRTGQIRWRDMTPKEYYHLDEQALEMLRTSGFCKPFDKEFIRKDGSRVPILISGTFLEASQESGVSFVLDLTERKQAEIALRESEARFRRLFESNIIGVLFSDLVSGKITDANEAFLEMVGYTKEDLHQGNVYWDKMTPPEYKHLDQQSIEELMRVGACTSFEKEYVRKDGTRVPIFLASAMLEGSKEHAVSFVLDLSDRKRAEQERAELLVREQKARSTAEAAKEQVSLILESITDGFLAFDSEWRFTYLNREGASTLGHLPEELVGKNLWEEFPELANTSFGQLSRQVVAEGVPLEREDYYPPFNSWFLARAYPTETGGLALYFQNITARKLAEAALLESEERFRHLADTAPVLIWMSGIDKLYNYFNKGWLNFTGRTMVQELGNGWTEGVHPDDFLHYLNTYTSAFDARQDFTIEYRLRRFDGKYRWLLDIGSPRFTPDGSFLGYIGSCMDITERKQAETEILKFNESLEQRVKERTIQLEAVNKELESFSYSVSHDLRAPLRHISGYVDLLSKQAALTLDETSRRYLSTISETTKHAGTLIDNLLAFSRMGRSQMHVCEFSLEQLVQEVQRTTLLETNGRAIIWQVEKLPQVVGDPSMLRLVISNLIDNAIKYTQTRTQAKIEIGSTENEQEVVFFIRDNGVGFDMRYVHKLFGVFQRLHSEQQFQGTGIGLANVQRIIQRHGGRTWAEGQVDSGATFYFSLPKRAQKEDECMN